MSKPESGLTVPEKQKEIAQILNNSVLSVIGDKALNGFEKAFVIANATKKLKEVLTTEYMKPIMELQGNRLGFKTDKDDKGGYDEATVKNCLIEAVLTGVQPFGNQFNIIAGNMYVTKEGFGQLLKDTQGLKYKIIPGLPRINTDKTSAAITMKMTHSLNGAASSEDEMEIPIRVNSFMGVDAIIGKATRKARAWLFNTIHGTEVADGDAVDVTAEVVSSRIDTKEKKDEAVGKTGENIFGK